MCYAIELWGHSTNSTRTFKLQKKAIRLISFSKRGSSCRKLFKELKIPTFYCEYFIKLLLLVKNNIHIYDRNADIHSHIQGQPNTSEYLIIQRDNMLVTTTI